MRFAYLLLSAACFGQSARVIGTTETQILLDVAGVASCTFTISNLSDAFPVVAHDPTLFPGSDSCGTFTNGHSYLVIGRYGQDAMQTGSDGRLYSRALFQDHTYQIAFTNGIPSITATTKITGPKPHMEATHYLPTANTSTPPVWAEPQTGVVLTTLPLNTRTVVDQPSILSSLPSSTSSTTPVVFPVDFCSGPNSAVYPYGCISRNYTGQAVLSFSVPVTMAFDACAGATCNIEYALVWSDTATPITGAEWKPLTITSSAASYTLGGSSVDPEMNDWRSTAGVIQMDTYLAGRKNNASCRVSSSVDIVTIDAPTNCPLFDSRWSGKGVKIFIGVSIYTIANVLSPTELQLTTAPVAITSQAYDIRPIGFAVRKAGASAATLTISAIGTATAAYNVPLTNPDAGGHEQVNQDISSIVDTDGYYLANTYNQLMVVEKSPAPGAFPTMKHMGGTDLFSPGTIPNVDKLNCNKAQFDPSNPRKMYCIVQNNGGSLADYTVFSLTASRALGSMPVKSGTQTITLCGSDPCWTATLVQSNIKAAGNTFQAGTFKDWMWDCNPITMQGPRFVFYCRPNQNMESGYGWIDTTTGQTVAVRNSYISHGGGVHNSVQYDNTYISIDAHPPIGGLTNSSGSQAPGAGPHFALTTTALSATPTSCPARPGTSPIRAADWPGAGAGGVAECSTVTLDGELCDPSPGAANVPFTGNTGEPLNGASFCNGGSAKYFAGALRPGWFLTLVTSPVIGSAPNFQTGCSAATHPNCEVVRVLSVSAGSGITKVVTLQRAVYNGRHNPSFLKSWSIGTNAMRTFEGTSYEENAAWKAGYFDPLLDPTGQGNADNSGIWLPYYLPGTGHAVPTPGQVFTAVHSGLTRVNPEPSNPEINYATYGWIGSSDETLPGLFSSATQAHTTLSVTMFQGTVGCCMFNNNTDSHSHAATFGPDKRTVIDGRAGNGTATTATGTFVTGTLRKFAAGTVGAALRPAHRDRLWPMTRMMIGTRQATGVSGPGSSIGGTSTDWYKWCYVMVAGECFSGSLPTELYVNAPSVNGWDCPTGGVATFKNDTNHFCTSEPGMYSTMNEIRTKIGENDLDGHTTRFLSVGGGSPYTNPFASGRWMHDLKFGFWPALNANDRTTTVMIAQRPRIDATSEASGWSYHNVSIVGGSAATSVRFGYVRGGGNESCVFRRSGYCETTATPTNLIPYLVQGESAVTTNCSSSCTIPVPLYPRRVAWFQVVSGGVPGAVQYIVSN